MMSSSIADAVKEVFGFLREWNNADQKQKRYALKRIKRIKKATDVAEDIFEIVDDMVQVARDHGLNNNAEFQRLHDKYNKLIQKFNDLD